MYQCCKMCIFSSYRGHFCEHWNRRTSANKGWCKDIILKKKTQEKRPNMIPDKIYIREYQDGDYTTWWDEKPHEEESIGMKAVCYIRKDIADGMVESAEDHAYFAGQEKLREKLLEWAKEMKKICKGAKPIEKAYQTVIDKIESL